VAITNHFRPPRAIKKYSKEIIPKKISHKIFKRSKFGFLAKKTMVHRLVQPREQGAP
jgi:hypothetical protein